VIASEWVAAERGPLSIQSVAASPRGVRAMEIRPKFRPDLQASRHQEGDGQERVVLNDPVSGKYYRLSVYEYDLLKAFDGSKTFEQVLEALQDAGHYYPAHKATVILGKAAQLGLLLGTKFGSSQYQRALKAGRQKAEKSKRLSSLYFLFIPLLNPDRFLESTLWMFKLVVNRWTGIAFALAAPVAAYMVIADLPSLDTEYLFFFNWQNLLCLWITIAFTKLVHEFSHAYVAKGYGLHVPEMGLAFLLFFPCLYCNTTDAWQLAKRRQRMAISAAGIIAETALAVIAAFIWQFTKPGLINSVAFYMMTFSLVSTILFNANPLMKFDGYFILMDYLRLPNLATKALKQVKHLWMERVLGFRTFPSPARNEREANIFTLYGIAAFIFRIFLFTGIVVGVYYRFDKLLGIVLAVFAFVLFIVRPVYRGTKTLLKKRKEIRPKPVGAVTMLLILAAVGLPLCIPISNNSVYPCYLDSRTSQKLTVPLYTLVENVFIKLGSKVTEGDLLFQLDPSMLELTLHAKQTQREIINKEINLLLLDREEMAKAAGKEIELLQVEDEIARIKKELEIARSSITAPFDGIVTSLDYRLQTGFQPGEGVVVGELQSPTETVIRALVPSADLAKVSEGQEVKIWFPIGTGRTLTKKIDIIRSYSERDLRNSPFSSRFGGELATEVIGEYQQDAPLEAQYDCSIIYDNLNDPIPLGMTGRLVVSSPPRSILARLVDNAAKTFNRESFL
jgi:putative peptide zinc metalloprotease protein